MTVASLQRGLALVVLAATASAAGAEGRWEGAREATRAPDAPSLRYASSSPGFHGATQSRRVASGTSWWGGSYVASTGESVNIVFADAYPQDPMLGKSWAELFAALVHGDELRSMRAYVAPLEWVREICGDRALGCYGGNELVTIGGPTPSVTPWQIAAHEYGHHVAANRENPPWNALHTGTKRWASYVNVCARAAAGTVFPGDEGDRYRLNPGEGFAEAYRVLNERKGGATAAFTWPIVDASFFPDDRALALIEQDVREPWRASAAHVIRLRERAARSWNVPLATPLDGRLDVTLDLKPGASYRMTLLAGKRIVSRGLWSSARGQSLQHTVCGERTLTLRLVRQSGPSRFLLRVAKP